MSEKTILYIHKITWFSLSTLLIILSIIIEPDISSKTSTFFWYLLISLTPISFCIFIISLTLSYKETKYFDNETSTYKTISVYAGFFHHWLKVNHILADEYNTSFFVTPIRLNTIIEENIKIDVTISTMNKITIKINTKLAL